MAVPNRPAAELKRQLFLREMRRVAFPLIERQGFEDTTVDELAAALGISRRTFFRYFAVKEDIVVGEFAEVGARMAAHLDFVSAQAPVDLDSLRSAMLAAIEESAFFAAEGRKLFRFTFEVPDLKARYIAMLETSAETLAASMAMRQGAARGSLLPRLSVMMLTEATGRWSLDPDKSIEDQVRDVFRELASLGEPRGSATRVRLEDSRPAEADRGT